MGRYFYIGLAALAVLAGCAPKANMAGYNMSHAYEPQAAANVRTRVLDNRESIRVYHSLTFAKMGAGSTPADIGRRYAASYKMTLGYQSQALIMQDTLDLARMTPNPDGTYSLAYNIKKPQTQSVVLVVYIQDRAGGDPLLFDVPLKIEEAAKAYKYALFDRKGSKPIFSQYLTVGDTASLRSLSLDAKPLIMRHYTAPTQAALPPMAVAGTLTLATTQPAQAVYNLKANNLIVFAEPGLYQITEDTLRDPGFTVLVEENKFPRVTKAGELVPPLIYMTTRAERAKLQGAPQPKRSLDAFWLDIAGNYESGRRLIKAWYENVEYANAYFTDYREGWKTDRGMVFIVFGKPAQVLRQGQMEEWLYDERGATPQMHFVFTQQAAPVGPPTWELRRAPDYDRYWYATVDQWRKGVIRR